MAFYILHQPDYSTIFHELTRKGPITTYLSTFIFTRYPHSPDDQYICILSNGRKTYETAKFVKSITTTIVPPMKVAQFYYQSKRLN